MKRTGAKALEDELKKAMGYTEDSKQRCQNCTHANLWSSRPGAADEWKCTANKALELMVSAEGRCNLFSAKRRRTAQEDAAAASNQRPEKSSEQY